MLVLVKSHLLIHSVLDLSSLLDLDDSWSISWVDQSYLIITIYFIELTNLDKIVDDLTTVGPPENLLTSSSLSLLHVFVPTLNGSFICLVNSLLANGANIDVLVQDIELSDGVVIVKTSSTLSILSLN